MIDSRRSRPGRIMLALLALGIAAPGGATAQLRQRGDTVPAYRIDTVSVTVVRSPVRVDAVPRKIEVISRADLEQTVATDLAQLLKKQAAVDVIEFPGLLAGIGLRGFRPQYSGIYQRTLVLIDGRPAGATNLALLELGAVERVEVLRGPASALYGSNAMGGVVNLVTRRSTGPIRSTVELGYGSWDTRQGKLRTGGAVGAGIDFDLTVSALEQADDYRVGEGNLFRGWLGDTAAVRIFPNDSVALSPELGSGERREFSSYGTRAASGRLGYELGRSWRADWRVEGLRADGVQNPGDLFFAWGDGRSLKDVARTSSDLAVGGTTGRHTLSVRAFTALEDADNYNAPEPLDDQPNFVSLRSRTRWHGVQLQDALSFGGQSLVFGGDYGVTRSQSERFGAPGSRLPPWEPDSEINSAAVFAEARLASTNERLVATLGGRFDHIGFRVHPTELWDGGVSAGNRESFTVLNPSFGLQYAIAPGVRLHGTAGRAFVTPTAFNVAGQVVRADAEAGGVHLTRGNPDLDPESSITWDAGVGLLRPLAGLDADVTYFRTRVRDRITTQRTAEGGALPAGQPVLSLTTYVNADAAEIRGLEWRLAYDFARQRARPFVLRPFVNASHLLHAEERVGDVERRIRNVAELTLNYGLEYDDLRRIRTRLTGRYVGERVDDDWNVWPIAEVRYPAFMTLDWVGELRLMERLRLGVHVSNLTDENYYEVRGYPLAGRAAQLRLSVDF